MIKLHHLLLYPLIALAGVLPAQSEIKIMSYNLLNFPTGNLAGRVDTLKNIVDYYRPHLLLIQELKTANGLAQVADMMSDLGYGSFAHTTFVPQQSNGGGGSNPLQQAIVYDTQIFGLKSQGVVTTSYRDFNYAVLYLQDPALAQGADTIFLYAYVTHLKSATGSANEQTRLAMVISWLNHLSTLPADARVLLAGDFNLYSNQEPAYTALMNPANYIHMVDPLAWMGNWTGASFAHKEYLTQSTRENVIYSDGAGGGVDDRFDFIVLSENLMDNGGPLHYMNGSHRSLGNNGNCYNNSITDCNNNNDVPFDILRSIYYMSDHIPQVMSLETGVELTGTHYTKTPLINLPKGNMVSGALLIQAQYEKPIVYRIVDASGHVVHEDTFVQNKQLDLSHWSTGIYAIQSTTGSNSYVTRFALVR